MLLLVSSSHVSIDLINYMNFYDSRKNSYPLKTFFFQHNFFFGSECIQRIELREVKKLLSESNNQKFEINLARD